MTRPTTGHRSPAAPDSVQGAAPLVSVEGVTVHYGQSGALFDVSVSVPQGSVVAVLGANGAGKSTLASAISGLVGPTSGRIVLDGVDVTSWPAHRRARKGVAHVLEGRGVFPSLSVAENLRLGMRRTVPRSEQSGALERAFELFPVLAERRKQQASTLSGGERQMLSLARLLASPPRLLIADELSLGLAPMLVQRVFEVIERTREAGVTIVLVEQYVERALELADSAVILRRGRLVWAGPATEAGDAVLDQYLGAEEAAIAAPRVEMGA